MEEAESDSCFGVELPSGEAKGLEAEVIEEVEEGEEGEEEEEEEEEAEEEDEAALAAIRAVTSVCVGIGCGVGIRPSTIASVLHEAWFMFMNRADGSDGSVSSSARHISVVRMESATVMCWWRSSFSAETPFSSQYCM